MYRAVAVVVVGLFVVTSAAVVGFPTADQNGNASTGGVDSGRFSGGSADVDVLQRVGPDATVTSDGNASNATASGVDAFRRGTNADWNVTRGADAGDRFTIRSSNTTNGTDTDGDGVVDAVENATGTDPFVADTDDDGLSDGTERRLGTDPTAPDTDHDGVGDRQELALGTDPSESDTDDDGLSDGMEFASGTEPTDPDTDGDRLLDGWEVRGETPAGVPLPDSDPLAMDLYVQFDYTQGVERPDGEVYVGVVSEFAVMDVENPDNSTGIDVHVREGGPINESVRFDGENFWSLKRTYYETRLGSRAGIYHHVVVSEFATDYAGYGEVGGEFSVMAAGADTDTQRHVVVHELLHNAVGKMEGPGACHGGKHYCAGGWLSPEVTPDRGEFLSESVATQLEARGFADG